MSRDIIVQDLPPLARTVAEIPDDFVPGSLGPSQDIIGKILHVVPSADFSDIEWGNIEAPTYSIEVNIEQGEAITSFALHVRGEGAEGLIAQILSAVGLRALDPASESGFFEPPLSN